VDAEPVAKFPLPVFKKMKTLIRRTIACASLMLLLGPMQSNGAGLPLALDGQTLPSLAPMLEEYYQFRGWDENGVPLAEKLAELDLGFTILD